MSSTDTANKISAFAEKVNVVVAVLSLLFVSLVVAVIGLAGLFNPIEPLAVAAAIVAILLAASVGGAVLAQTCWEDKYRKPSGGEIGGDLRLSLWGALFTAPLLVVSVNGELITWGEGWVAVGLTVVGAAVPAVRARRR